MTDTPQDPLLVAGLYGTAMLYSLVPAAGISWSGHFWVSSAEPSPRGCDTREAAAGSGRA